MRNLQPNIATLPFLRSFYKRWNRSFAARHSDFHVFGKYAKHTSFPVSLSQALYSTIINKVARRFTEPRYLDYRSAKREQDLIESSPARHTVSLISVHMLEGYASGGTVSSELKTNVIFRRTLAPGVPARRDPLRPALRQSCIGFSDPRNAGPVFDCRLILTGRATPPFYVNDESRQLSRKGEGR